MKDENKKFDLKECPFCGNRSALLRQPYFAYMWMIECRKCFCSTPLFDTKQKAVDFWNRRNGDNG